MATRESDRVSDNDGRVASPIRPGKRPKWTPCPLHWEHREALLMSKLQGEPRVERVEAVLPPLKLPRDIAAFAKASAGLGHFRWGFGGGGVGDRCSRSLPRSVGMQCLRPHLNPPACQHTRSRIAGSFWRQELPPFPAGDSTHASGFSFGPTQSVPTPGRDAVPAAPSKSAVAPAHGSQQPRRRPTFAVRAESCPWFPAAPFRPSPLPQACMGTDEGDNSQNVCPKHRVCRK